MKIFIFAGEHPANLQHVESVIDSLEDSDEYVLYVGKKIPKHSDFEYGPGILVLIQKLFSRLGMRRNKFDHEKYEMRFKTHKVINDWSQECDAIKSTLPWRPDIVIVITPNQGHTKDHIVPWSQREKIPILSIDHGTPTVNWPWLGYRGSDMGCNANAVWSDVCRSINIQVGASESSQIITGSPSIDPIVMKNSNVNVRKKLSIPKGTRVILLLGTHRKELKNVNDQVFNEVINHYANNKHYTIVYKPHPVEISKSEVLEVPESVITTYEQNLYIPLIRISDTVISPATSVIVPAMALYRPFVNTLSAISGVISEDEEIVLESRLCGALFPTSQLHEVIQGERKVDRAACDRAFEKFGYKKDGRNGERVVSLMRWIVMGMSPAKWKDNIS